MHVLRALALGVAAVLLVGGAAAVLVSAEAADGLVHPDRKRPETGPWDAGLPWRNVSFPATDGVPLHAWWIPAGEDAPVVIFFHGYGESKHQGLRVAEFLHGEGVSVLLPDFRAHGASGGEFTTVGLLETRDVAGAVGWVHARMPCDGRPDRVALVGWSMGGAAALNAAPDLDVAAVVTDSTFADLKTLVGTAVERYTGLPTFPFAALTVLAGERETGVDVGDNKPAASAARVRAPLLVVHGTDDDVAEPGSAGRIAGAQPGARVLLVQGAGHVASWDVAPGLYQSSLLDFLRDSFSAAEAAEPRFGG